MFVWVYALFLWLWNTDTPTVFATDSWFFLSFFVPVCSVDPEFFILFTTLKKAFLWDTPNHGQESGVGTALQNRTIDSD